jgi:hypothetical protein
MYDVVAVCLGVSAAALVAAGVVIVATSSFDSSAAKYLAWCSGTYLAMALVSLLPSPSDDLSASSSLQHAELRPGMARMVAAACRTRPWAVDAPAL